MRKKIRRCERGGFVSFCFFSRFPSPLAIKFGRHWWPGCGRRGVVWASFIFVLGVSKKSRQWHVQSGSTRNEEKELYVLRSFLPFILQKYIYYQLLLLTASLACVPACLVKWVSLYALKSLSFNESCKYGGDRELRGRHTHTHTHTQGMLQMLSSDVRASSLQKIHKKCKRNKGVREGRLSRQTPHFSLPFYKCHTFFGHSSCFCYFFTAIPLHVIKN